MLCPTGGRDTTGGQVKIGRKRGWVAGGLVGVVLAGVVAWVLLAGRGSAPSQPPVAQTTSGPTTSAPHVATVPLTGMPLTPGVDLNHPAVAVKISDVRQAHPQVGVDKADIVFVEPIGVAYTRLLAVFHSHIPGIVGPVRSMRPMEAPLLSPMAPVFANTMAAPWVVRYIDSAATVDNLGTLKVSGSGAYVVDRSRRPPDHVFVKPEVLLGISDFHAPPAPYFSYAADAASSSAATSTSGSAGSGSASAGSATVNPAGAVPGTAPGAAAVIPYGLGWNVKWTYSSAAGRYMRSEPWGPHRAADGTRVSAANVLVLSVPSKVGKIGSGAGAPVPILSLVNGSGRFIALSAGHAVTGTWSKAGLRDHFVLRTDAGQPLLLAPGNTWVEMPAPSAHVTTS